MPIAVLYPRYDHPAIEERFASWQTQMLLRGGEELAPLSFYDDEQPAARIVAGIKNEHVLAITDPLLLPSSHLGVRLRAALEESGAAAVLPVSNGAQHSAQLRPPRSVYLTVRELQETIEATARQPRTIQRVTWDGTNPGAYLCPVALLRETNVPVRTALAGRDVVIVENEYIHRWSSLRGQIRYDLLDRISPEAKSILEFGCGEAPLGEALKRRQPCRVVGIELDPDAAAVAKKRIDAVYRGDVREIVEILDETFDWIIGGDIVEHLDEPWSFLAELRRLAVPGGHLLLSLPNLANASVIGDLLQGRFDYAYMGLTCVGHLRFFTKQSIADMLTIAGWTVETIAPQELASTPAQNALLHALDISGYAYSKDDVMPTGYYVIARNG
jgi:2-polyprenyl-3-methyl-5-hydroxy-6-metoxy-1,4-benzoquinol methylase